MSCNCETCPQAQAIKALESRVRALEIHKCTSTRRIELLEHQEDLIHAATVGRQKTPKWIAAALCVGRFFFHGRDWCKETKSSGECL